VSHPEGVLYLYEGADHGFNCEQRSSFNAEAAALARQRTLGFFARYIAGEQKND
jgi:carboxymethylenebutenolidase